MGGRLWLTACLFYIGTAWGLVPSLAKLAMVEGADVLAATFQQSLAGGLLLVLLTLIRGKAFRLSWHHIWFYTVCGFTGTTIPTAIVFAASAEVGAGMIAIMIALAPVLTYLGALVFGVESADRWRMAGVALGFLAIILIVVPDLEFGSGALTIWLLAALLIPVCYGAESLIITLKRPSDGDAVMLVAGMLLSSAVVLFPVVLLAGTLETSVTRMDSAAWAVGAIVLINVSCYVMFLYLISAAGPVFATFAGYLNMAAGVMWGILLWQESFTPWIWGAVFLLAGAMYLVRERPPSPLP